MGFVVGSALTLVSMVGSAVGSATGSGLGSGAMVGSELKSTWLLGDGLGSATGTGSADVGGNDWSSCSKRATLVLRGSGEGAREWWKPEWLPCE